MSIVYRVSATNQRSLQGSNYDFLDRGCAIAFANGLNKVGYVAIIEMLQGAQ